MNVRSSLSTKSKKPVLIGALLTAFLTFGAVGTASATSYWHDDDDWKDKHYSRWDDCGDRNHKHSKWYDNDWQRWGNDKHYYTSYRSYHW